MTTARGGAGRSLLPAADALAEADERLAPRFTPAAVERIVGLVPDAWLGDEPARPGARYLIKHTTRSVPARLEAIEHRLDVTTLEYEPADELELNAIGRVRLRLASPLVPDPYERVRATGAFIVVDEATNDTVGAGMTA